VITTATDRSSDDELAAAARAVLDRMNADRVIELKSEFGKRLTSGRATTDITDAARAATLGAIDLLLVDIDGDIPGTVDETTGAVSFADAPSAGTYDVVDEIAGRALATGAQVMGVRKGDLPENGELAAMLRFAT